MNIFAYLAIAVISIAVAYFNVPENNSVKSGVYSWNTKNANGIILQGETTDLENLTIFAKTLLPGESYDVEKNELKDETMLIFKNGKSKLNFGENQKILNPGSIAIIYPNEKYSVKNVEDDNSEFYLFQYKSKEPANLERGKNAGGSFYVDWDTLEFKPHDKGGIREYCNRPSEMLKYFEMHVTTLNPGIKSHEPHIHTSDEMVIMIKGNTSMQIGDSHYNGTDGDIYFLGANIPHAIGNNGKESCMYYAFHLE